MSAPVLIELIERDVSTTFQSYIIGSGEKVLQLSDVSDVVPFMRLRLAADFSNDDVDQPRVKSVDAAGSTVTLSDGRPGLVAGAAIVFYADALENVSLTRGMDLSRFDMINLHHVTPFSGSVLAADADEAALPTTS